MITLSNIHNLNDFRSVRFRNLLKGHQSKKWIYYLVTQQKRLDPLKRHLHQIWWAENFPVVVSHLVQHILGIFFRTQVVHIHAYVSQARTFSRLLTIRQRERETDRQTET